MNPVRWFCLVLGWLGASSTPAAPASSHLPAGIAIAATTVQNGVSAPVVVTIHRK